VISTCVLIGHSGDWRAHSKVMIAGERLAVAWLEWTEWRCGRGDHPRDGVVASSARWRVLQAFEGPESGITTATSRAARSKRYWTVRQHAARTSGFAGIYSLGYFGCYRPL
jgi:hypothetical protein